MIGYDRIGYDRIWYDRIGYDMIGYDRIYIGDIVGEGESEEIVGGVWSGENDVT